MFSCPNFCGGAYIHGDEAYPYPEKGSMLFAKFFHYMNNIKYIVGAFYWFLIRYIYS